MNIYAQNSITTPHNNILTDSTIVIQINPSIAKLKFDFIVSAVNSTNEFSDGITKYEVNIYSLSTDSLIQSFSETAYIFEDDYSFEFTDINFDSYLDISLVNSISANGMNTGNSFWIYNKHSNNFSLSYEFSKLSNPDVDDDSKKIYTSNFSTNSDEFEVYVVENDKLVMVERSEIERYIDENDDKYYRKIKIYKLVDGDMKLVEEIKEPME
jgi:hypothetical protein